MNIFAEGVKTGILVGFVSLMHQLLAKGGKQGAVGREQEKQKIHHNFIV